MSMGPPRFLHHRSVRALCIAGVSVASLLFSEGALASSEKTPKAPKAPKVSKKELPAVTTGGAGKARGTSVELKGSINPRGEAATYYFQYGATVAYGAQSTPATLPAGTTKVKVAATVAGFQPGYHYRLVASNSHGQREGADHTYVLKSGALKLTLARASILGHPIGSPITITGSVSGAGAANHVVVLQSSAYPYSEAFKTIGSPQAAGPTGAFSFSVASLAQNTQYRVATLDPQPSYSHIITELATVSVTLHVRKAAHGGLVRLYGTVSPAQVGARILFQLQKATAKRRSRPPRSEKAEERAEEKAELPAFSTKFTTTLKRATKALSRFSSVVKIRLQGRYRAYVALPKGPVAPGYSTTVLLHAAKKKKSKRRA